MAIHTSSVSHRLGFVRHYYNGGTRRGNVTVATTALPGAAQRTHPPAVCLVVALRRFLALMVVIPVADRNLDYARRIGDELTTAGFRAEVDERQERMNAKIRDAQLQKISYMLVVGNREEEARGVSVRLRTNENRA